MRFKIRSLLKAAVVLYLVKNDNVSSRGIIALYA